MIGHPSGSPMRRALLLSALLFLPALTAVAAEKPKDAQAWAPVEQGLIQRLRQAGPLTRSAALSDLRALPGYPKSARFAIPILYWMQSDEDLDLRSQAATVLRDLKWPQVSDIKGARAFASRQDTTYKLMAVKALAQVVERDPEAMLLMIKLCHKRNGAVADFAAAQGKLLLARPCRSQADADAWSAKLAPFSQDFQSELQRPSRQARSLLTLLTTCGGWDPLLSGAAEDALKRIPL